MNFARNIWPFESLDMMEFLKNGLASIKFSILGRPAPIHTKIVGHARHRRLEFGVPATPNNSDIYSFFGSYNANTDV